MNVDWCKELRNLEAAEMRGGKGKKSKPRENGICRVPKKPIGAKSEAKSST